MVRCIVSKLCFFLCLWNFFSFFLWLIGLIHLQELKVTQFEMTSLQTKCLLWAGSVKVHFRKSCCKVTNWKLIFCRARLKVAESLREGQKHTFISVCVCTTGSHLSDAYSCSKCIGTALGSFIVFLYLFFPHPSICS